MGDGSEETAYTHALDPAILDRTRLLSSSGTIPLRILYGGTSYLVTNRVITQRLESPPLIESTEQTLTCNA